MKNLKFILLALAHFVFLASSAQAHYDPNIGRWLSRDPIGERGGMNLYASITNNGINFIDYLGLFDPNNPDFVTPTWDDKMSAVTWPVPDEFEDSLSGSINFKVSDLTNNGATSTITLGVELARTGSLRLDYSRLAQELQSAGLSGEDAAAARDALKAEFQAKQTALGKALTQQLLEQRQRLGHVAGRANPGKTYVKFNGMAKVFKYSGRALAVIGVGVEVYNVATAPEGEKLGEAARAGGRMGGGILGGMGVGALGGAYLGPWGAAGGAIIGGIGGSIGGEAVVEIVCPEK